jgi:hypothetical protein
MDLWGSLKPANGAFVAVEIRVVGCDARVKHEVEHNEAKSQSRARAAPDRSAPQRKIGANVSWNGSRRCFQLDFQTLAMT